jgi:hypothetical protein
MKKAIFVVLLLILLLFGGYFWTLHRERSDSETRNRESAKQAAEAERKSEF